MHDDARFELTVDGIAALGDGVGRRADGMTVFVPFSAPGDRLRVRVVERRRRYLRAEIEEVIAPGATRVVPRCAVFGRCGGCTWQHVDYGAQLDAKRRIVADAMTRIGGLALGEAPPIHASPDPYAYRARARVLARAGEVGYRMRGSHALCAIDACPVLVPALAPALDDVRRLSTSRDGESEWQLAIGTDGRATVHAVDETTPGSVDGEIELAVGGDRLRLSAAAFGQANGLLWETLHDRVVDAAGTGERLLELYAGAGFFTLGLARRFAQVEAIESDEAAAGDLAANLARAGAVDVSVIDARVEDAVPDGLSIEPEVVVLDPPRRGISESIARHLAGLGPRRIVYLSCDPATLARDSGRLASSGFALVSVEAFDLFPQTPHVEAMAILDRCDGAGVAGSSGPAVPPS